MAGSSLQDRVIPCHDNKWGGEPTGSRPRGTGNGIRNSFYLYIEFIKGNIEYFQCFILTINNY